MHIDIDDGDNSLYMFDENGEAVVLAELHGHHPREFAHIVKCVNHHDELVAMLCYIRDMDGTWADYLEPILAKVQS